MHGKPDGFAEQIERCHINGGLCDVVSADGGVHQPVYFVKIGRIFSKQNRADMTGQRHGNGFLTVASEKRPRVAFAIADQTGISVDFCNNRGGFRLYAIFFAENVGVLQGNTQFIELDFGNSHLGDTSQHSESRP